MHMLTSCKSKEDTIKNEGASMFMTFSLCLSMGEFFRRSRAANSAVHGPIRLNLELSPDLIVVLVTYEN